MGGFFISTLLILLKLKNNANTELKEENKELKRQIELGQHNASIKNFEATQDVLLEVAKEKMKEEKYKKLLNTGERIDL